MAQDVGMVFVAEHAVPDWESWFEKYKEFKAENAKDNKNELGIFKSVVSQKLETNAEGKPMVQVIQYFPKSKLETMKKFFTFKDPPFVGGPDLIKNGFIIEPIKSYYAEIQAEVTFDQMMEPGIPLSICVGSCGIPEWEKWYQEFMNQADFSRSLGVISATVGKREDKHENGKDLCFMAQIFPSTQVETMKKTMKYDEPPFVGGPDLFKNGILFPPMDFHLYTVQGFSSHLTETKTVILPPTIPNNNNEAAGK